MNKLTIDYEDAIQTMKMFHSLPEDTEITILPENFHVTQEAKKLLVAVENNWGRKIPMIKEMRQIYGCGLKEAKFFIDEVVNDCGGSQVRWNNKLTEDYVYDLLKRHTLE